MAYDDAGDAQERRGPAAAATPASIVLDSVTKAVDEALNQDANAVRDSLRDAVDGLDGATVGAVKDDDYGGTAKPREAGRGRVGDAPAAAPKAGDPDQARMQAVVDLARTQDKDTQKSVTDAYVKCDLARKANARAEDKVCAAARSALSAARDVWTTASGDYEHDIDAAATTLNAALETAAGTYAARHNRDSQSRDQVLYYSMATDAATALQAYQGTVTSEAGTLAGAAGTLLTAYVTYMTAVETARAQRMHDDATARHDFWTTVEGVLDAP